MLELAVKLLLITCYLLYILQVSTLVSLDLSQNKLQALEAAVLAQGIANWFVPFFLCPVCFACTSNKAHAPQHHARQLSRPTTLTHDNRQHSHTQLHSRMTTLTHDNTSRTIQHSRTPTLTHDNIRTLGKTRTHDRTHAR